MKKTIIGLPAKPPFPHKKEKKKSDKQLYKYQKKGVMWLEEHNGTGLVGDDMGLGKSCQALTYCKVHPKLRPVLIVCPATLKLNWQREIIKWTGEESLILYKKKSSPVPEYPFYIINYDILAEEMIIKVKNKKGIEVDKKILLDSSWIYKLAELGIKAIIIDECQNISGEKPIRSKALVTLKENISKVKLIALSGTPIQNRPKEFFTVLNLLDPKIFSSRYSFYNRYCGPKIGYGNRRTYDGASNMKVLSKLVHTVMIRRTKAEVMKDLPAKQKIIIPMETNTIALRNYENALDEFRGWAKSHIDAGLEAQQNIERLKQLAYLTKRNSVIKWIEQYIESGNKLVVGTFHKNAINDLYSHFKNISVKIDGSITGNKRQEAVDIFQSNKKIKLFFGQLITVLGLNLTAAAATCTVEFGWTPATHEQFEDRVHRIGQEADSVFAYYLIAPGTFDDDCMVMVNSKYGIIKNLLDGKKDADLFENSFINSILKKYGSKML